MTTPNSFKSEETTSLDHHQEFRPWVVILSHKHTFVEVLPTHNAFPSMHLGNFGEILSTKATGGSERNLSSSHNLAIVAHGR
jgi:hypothetical protein